MPPFEDCLPRTVNYTNYVGWRRDWTVAGCQNLRVSECRNGDFFRQPEGFHPPPHLIPVLLPFHSLSAEIRASVPQSRTLFWRQKYQKQRGGGVHIGYLGISRRGFGFPEGIPRLRSPLSTDSINPPIRSMPCKEITLNRLHSTMA